MKFLFLRYGIYFPLQGILRYKNPYSVKLPVWQFGMYLVLQDKGWVKMRISRIIVY